MVYKGEVFNTGLRRFVPRWMNLRGFIKCLRQFFSGDTPEPLGYSGVPNLPLRFSGLPLSQISHLKSLSHVSSDGSTSV